VSLPDGCLNNNQYEREILLDYMSSQGFSTNDIYLEICDAIDNGTYTTTINSKTVAKDDYSCLSCAIEIFKNLIYEFRVNIKKEDLHSYVTKRADW
jgi:hypothetical protein